MTFRPYSPTFYRGGVKSAVVKNSKILVRRLVIKAAKEWRGGRPQVAMQGPIATFSCLLIYYTLSKKCKPKGFSHLLQTSADSDNTWYTVCGIYLP